MKYYRIGWKEGCECGNLKWIGEDGGGNEYYQCEDCEAIIVRPEVESILEGQDCEMKEGELICKDKPK